MLLNVVNVNPLEILKIRQGYYGPGDTEYSVRLHYMVILLPIFTKEGVSLCDSFSGLIARFDAHDELLLVVRQKVSEYLEAS